MVFKDSVDAKVYIRKKAEGKIRAKWSKHFRKYHIHGPLRHIEEFVQAHKKKYQNQNQYPLSREAENAQRGIE